MLQLAPLASHHELDSFNSGVESLDIWLKRRAMKNQSTGAWRTFVVCEQQVVIADYALASLVRDAGCRVIQAVDMIGIRGLTVYAHSAEAKAFYEQVGFESSPLDTMTLMMKLTVLRTSLEA